MYVPDALKVNKFADARIPSNKDYFRRVGTQSLPEGQYTADELAPMPMDKISQMTAAEQQLFDEMRAHEAGENGK